MKKINLIFMAFLLLFVACNGKKDKSEELDLNAILIENTESFALEISEETLGEIIQSIPSPLETAAVIRESGISFKEKLLNPSDNVDLYSTYYDKALNIGVYGGDLGYINMYEKSYLAFNYLNAIKELADDIKVGHFFDFTTIKRLASNSNKLDSLIFISTNNFNKMDSYLRSQKRGNLSVLVVTGTWLEGLYIATQVVNDKKNEQIIERIGEQKIVLDQIMLILSMYENDEFFKQIIDDFNKISSVYDQVSITYEYKEPEMQEINGMMVIVDNSTSTVNITDEQIQQIGQVVEDVREKLIKRI